MHPLLLLLLSLSLSLPLPASAADNSGGGGGVSLWCVARNDADDTALQTALDWACSAGNGAVDCSPVQQGGPCFDPDDLQFHASYAFNEYYLRHSAEPDACVFAGNAAVSQLNPAVSFQNVNPACKFPATISAGNGTIVGTVSTTDGLSPGGGGGSDQPSGAAPRAGGITGPQMWWRRAVVVWAVLAAVSRFSRI